MSQTRHVPVMLQRCLDLLAPALQAPGPQAPVVVDCTLGLGGHSEALLSAFPSVRLIGLDRDKEALRLSGERLAPYGDRATLVHAVYDELPEVLARLGIPKVQGVLFDLGVSSMQLDEADRGFAYAQDAPLDMRMDQTTGIGAAEVLNTYPPGELVRILRAYGEEKQAKRIVSAIVREREKEPFSNSARLVELIRDSLPQAAKRTGGNPAKRTFQALRIEVNGEPQRPGAGHSGGRAEPRGRRPDRRPLVPLAGGPAGQAGVRGGRRHHGAARTAGRPRALPAPAEAADPRRGTAHRGGGRREPARRPRTAARRPADPRGGTMSARPPGTRKPVMCGAAR